MPKVGRPTDKTVYVNRAPYWQKAAETLHQLSLIDKYLKINRQR